MRLGVWSKQFNPERIFAMTTIETMYAGRELKASGNTEKEASRALAKVKKAVRVEEDARNKNRDIAYTRARESICRIAEKIQYVTEGNRNNWYVRDKTPLNYDYKGSYLYEFGNQYGYAKYEFYATGSQDLSNLSVLEAVDGHVAMHDPVTFKWYGIGICEHEIAFVELPGFIADRLAMIAS